MLFVQAFVHLFAKIVLSIYYTPRALLETEQNLIYANACCSRGDQLPSDFHRNQYRVSTSLKGNDGKYRKW